MHPLICRRIWPVMAAVILLTACGDGMNKEETAMTVPSVTPDVWQAITRKRIAFGHQSVGNNIISGIRTLAMKSEIPLKIIESRNIGPDSGITHFRIGQNGDPASKIKDFSEVVRSGQAPDIALMKLCYVDIESRTDAEKLAKDYIKALEELSRQFPQTVFVAVTTPITVLQRGPKAWVKKLLGRSTGLAENLRRQEFNQAVRSRFGSRGRIFDLAGAEAEGVGEHMYEGRNVAVMNPAISSDGGHLNDRGAQMVAADLLFKLAEL